MGTLLRTLPRPASSHVTRVMDARERPTRRNARPSILRMGSLRIVDSLDAAVFPRCVAAYTRGLDGAVDADGCDGRFFECFCVGVCGEYSDGFSRRCVAQLAAMGFEVC